MNSVEYSNQYNMFEATNNLFFVIMNDFHVIFLTEQE